RRLDDFDARMGGGGGLGGGMTTMLFRSGSRVGSPWLSRMTATIRPPSSRMTPPPTSRAGPRQDRGGAADGGWASGATGGKTAGGPAATASARARRNVARHRGQATRSGGG